MLSNTSMSRRNWRCRHPTKPTKLLFDEGFRQYKSFCMQVSSFATTDKIQRGNSNIIPFDDDEVQPI
jgi:hypothetical protein